MNLTALSNSSDVLRAASSIVLPPLPCAENALEPVISAKPLRFHYGKHHKAYLDNLKKVIAGSEYSDLSLEEIIKSTEGRSERTAIFNNALQIWNHTFYWNSLSPKGGGEPQATLKHKIEASFGSATTGKIKQSRKPETPGTISEKGAESSQRIEQATKSGPTGEKAAQGIFQAAKEIIASFGRERNALAETTQETLNPGQEGAPDEGHPKNSKKK